MHRQFSEILIAIRLLKTKFHCYNVYGTAVTVQCMALMATQHYAIVPLVLALVSFCKLLDGSP